MFVVMKDPLSKLRTKRYHLVECFPKLSKHKNH